MTSWKAGDLVVLPWCDCEENQRIVTRYDEPFKVLTVVYGPVLEAAPQWMTVEYGYKEYTVRGTDCQRYIEPKTFAERMVMAPPHMTWPALAQEAKKRNGSK